MLRTVQHADCQPNDQHAACTGAKKSSTFLQLSAVLSKPKEKSGLSRTTPGMAREKVGKIEFPTLKVDLYSTVLHSPQMNLKNLENDHPPALDSLAKGSPS
jgi:hypothetical protein